MLVTKQIRNLNKHFSGNMIFLALRGVLFLSVIGCYSVALVKLINEFFVTRYQDYLNDEVAKNPRLRDAPIPTSSTFYADSPLVSPLSKMVNDDNVQKFNLQNDDKFQNNYEDDDDVTATIGGSQNQFKSNDVCKRFSENTVGKIQLKPSDVNDKLMASDVHSGEDDCNNCKDVVDEQCNQLSEKCEKENEKYEKSNNPHQCTLSSPPSCYTLSPTGTIRTGADNQKRKSEKLIESKCGGDNFCHSNTRSTDYHHTDVDCHASTLLLPPTADNSGVGVDSFNELQPPRQLKSKNKNKFDDCGDGSDDNFEDDELWLQYWQQKERRINDDANDFCPLSRSNEPNLMHECD